MGQKVACLVAYAAAATGSFLALLCLALHTQASWTSSPQGQMLASLGALTRAHLMRAHLSFTAGHAHKHYIYSRPPPEGFNDWVAFAQENQCVLDSYEGIEKDLAPFQALPGGITQDLIEKAKAVSKVIIITISNGSMSYKGTAKFPNPGFASGRITQMMSSFVHLLPDMELVVSETDEPRILPGEVDDIKIRYSSVQCQNASEEFRERRHLHGFVVSPMYALYGQPSRELLPVFSQTKIDNCYSDIVIPTWFNWGYRLSKDAQKQLLPWEERIENLFFRGGPTGGLYVNDSDYEMSHRHRLVALAKDHPKMDIMFTTTWGCTGPNGNAVCQRMGEKYGIGNWTDEVDFFKFKYLIAVDGMTFISRLPKYPTSGSLVFRAGIFSEWYDERLKPYEHFIPVRLDYSDLEEKLHWAINHDSKAAEIAAKGQEVANTQLRDADMECYLYRLLLEYNMLLKKQA